MKKENSYLFILIFEKDYFYRIMAEPFKNMYNEQFFDRFTKDLLLVVDNLK